MKRIETDAIRCLYKAGEPPEEMVYPCFACEIAWKPPKRRHSGKHLECTFTRSSPGKIRKREQALAKERTATESGVSKSKSEKAKKPPKKKRVRKKKPGYRERSEPKHSFKQPKKTRTPPVPVDDEYDGYYDDVLPLDNGGGRQGIDTAMAQKIALLIVVVLLIVAICVGAMYFL